MKISQPDVTINITPASDSIGNSLHRVLFVGQKTSTGTATSGVVTQNIGYQNEWDGLFGKTSHLAGMIRQFRRINKVTPIDVVAYSDASGTNASGTITFTGPATAAGTMTVTVGSTYENTYTISVASGDTATTIAAAVVSAITADTYSQVTAANVAGVVTVTAVHKGTIGNNIPIKVLNNPAGTTVAIVAMASGATDPTISGLSALIDGQRYGTIVFPGQWGTSTINSIMQARWNITNQILDGMVILTKADTYSNLSTWVATLNQQQIVAIGNPLVASSTRLMGGAIVEHNDNISAQFAAIRALRLTTGTNISDFITSRVGPKDRFGGAHLASLPFFNTPFANLPVIKQGDGFTRAQIEALQLVGVSVLGNNVAGNSIIAGEIVTTYLTDSAGNSDYTFKYMEYVDTVSQIREYYYNNLKIQYGQCRLTDGALVADMGNANADSIAAYVVSLYSDLTDAGYVLARGGEAALNSFKRHLSVSLDLITGTATVLISMPIVVQLRTINAVMQIPFSTF